MTKIRDCWRTPKHVFEQLDAEFYFDIDAAANENDHLCPIWIGPGGVGADLISLSRIALRDIVSCKSVFMNPPFSRLDAFIYQARAMSIYAKNVVCLVPGSKSEKQWWPDSVIGYASEVRHILKRLHYDPPPGVKPSSPWFGSVVLVYSKDACSDVATFGTRLTTQEFSK